MPIHLYALLTWTTRQRETCISPSVADFLERLLPSIALRHRARVLELGIVPDHVHALLQLDSGVDIPRLVQGLKGASARLANRDGVATKLPLRWASGYDFRSVSPGALPRVCEYVRRQPGRLGNGVPG